MIDILLILQHLETTSWDLKKSSKGRKDLAIQIKEFHYEEVETEGLFETINSNDTTSTNLLEKKRLLNKVIGLKRKHEIQLVRICEVTEQKKKVEEDKVFIEEDKRIIETRLEERISNVQKLTNIQLDMMNQLMHENQNLNKKDVEIENLIS